MKITETQIIEEYINGVPTTKLAELHGKTHSYYNYVLRKNGVSLKSQLDVNRKKSKWTGNENIFSDFSVEGNAYWFGFLMADGCIYKNQIQLGLCEKDMHHLEKFKAFTEGSSSINGPYNKKWPSYRYIFCSKIVVDRLFNLGLTPRKTQLAKIPVKLLDNRHVWRGVVDGDGFLGHSKNKPRIGLCGTKEICDQFLQFCATNTKRTIRTTPWRVKNNHFAVHFSGRKIVLDILHLLYKDSAVYLDRKYAKYVDIVERFNY